MASIQFPLSTRAVVARINRRLTKDGWLRLRKSRPGRWQSSLGEYYLHDGHCNAILRDHVDPESLARELELMSDREFVDDDA